ncbi:Bifunctional transcriptional activator/DNA repair enzyme AdaA [compost metagenome]
MAPTYFSRFFKKTTGETYHSYLTSIRLYHAHKDLLNRDASITDIALANGFANVKAFIEAFKKGYHATPAQYRKDHHGGRR